MPQTLDEPITQPMFSTDRECPDAFMWRGQRHVVLEQGGGWVLRGRWWLGEGDKRVFRLRTTDSLVVSLYRDEMTGQWSVAEVMD